MSRTCLTAAFTLTTALAVGAPAGAQTAAAQSTAPAAATPQAALTPQTAPPATTTAPATGTSPTTAQAPAKPAAAPPTITGGIKPPADYVIGIDDALEVLYWQDKDMSAAVTVRPDGNISLPLLNDVKAAGLTPEELRTAIATAATKFVEDPTVSVVVKAINSRKVFITGQVGKPGPYALMDTTTVLQMLATAGGPTEYAKTDKITIVRRENGKDVAHQFNYKSVSQGKGLAQNIELKPGDVVVVP